MRKTPRMRRLNSDRRRLEQLAEQSTIFEFECFGDPAESYVLRFLGNGLWRDQQAQTVKVRHVHEVRVSLSASYPRLMPELHWLTPIFHPNVSAGGVVCLGGYGTYWVPSLMLDELCEMLWDMIRYQNFDVDSPYNRDAAAWTKTQKALTLPLDRRPIRDKVADGIVDVRNDIQPSRPTFGNLPEVFNVEVDIRHVELITPTVVPDILFLDDESDVVTAEIVQDNESDILVIE
jgi:ubiquitin-protein ligase